MGAQSQPWSRAELVGGTLYWLVDLHLAGRVYRLATQRHDVPIGAGGADVAYLPGVVTEIEWQEAIELGAAPTARSLSLELLAPWIDVRTLRESLGTARLVLRRWLAGTSRVVDYLRGWVLLPEYGAADDPIRLTVHEDPWDDLGELIPAAAQVDADTWPTAADKAQGERYPWVYGYPGRAASGAVPGSPGYRVDSTSRYLLVAGHETEAGHRGASLTIYDADNGTSGTRVASHVADGRGRIVTVVTLPASGTLAYSGGTEWWVSWPALGGGLLRQAAPGAPAAYNGYTAARALGDVLEDLLGRSRGVEIDRGAWATAGRLLSGYQVDAAITVGQGDSPSPLSWVLDHVVGQRGVAPASVVGGPGGLGLHAWDLGATVAEAHPVTVERGRFERAPGSMITYSPLEECAGRLMARYAMDARGGNWTAAQTLSESRSNSTLPGNSESEALRRAASLFGTVRQMVEVGLPTVYDSVTAARVLGWMARWRALPCRFARFIAGQEYGWVRPGDVLSITDAIDFQLSSQVAHVVSVRYLVGGAHEIGVVMI
jgi:hypothetical protein